MTANKTRVLLGLVTVGAGIAAAIIAPATAHADQAIGNCLVTPWGIFGLTQKRIICDQPIRPDGSWMRERMIGTPAHYEPATTSCSGGSYYSRCTTYPGGWVEEQVADDETYPVTPSTVLPDEPGHLPASAPAPPPPPSTVA